MKITKNRDLSHRKFEEKGKIISITKDKKDDKLLENRLEELKELRLEKFLKNFKNVKEINSYFSEIRLKKIDGNYILLKTDKFKKIEYKNKKKINQFLKEENENEKFKMLQKILLWEHIENKNIAKFNSQELEKVFKDDFKKIEDKLKSLGKSLEKNKADFKKGDNEEVKVITKRGLFYEYYRDKEIEKFEDDLDNIYKKLYLNSEVVTLSTKIKELVNQLNLKNKIIKKLKEKSKLEYLDNLKNLKLYQLSQEYEELSDLENFDKFLKMFKDVEILNINIKKEVREYYKTKIIKKYEIPYNEIQSSKNFCEFLEKVKDFNLPIIAKSQIFYKYFLEKEKINDDNIEYVLPHFIEIEINTLLKEKIYKSKVIKEDKIEKIFFDDLKLKELIKNKLKNKLNNYIRSLGKNILLLDKNEVSTSEINMKNRQKEVFLRNIIGLSSSAYFSLRNIWGVNLEDEINQKDITIKSWFNNNYDLHVKNIGLEKVKRNLNLFYPYNFNNEKNENIKNLFENIVRGIISIRHRILHYNSEVDANNIFNFDGVEVSELLEKILKEEISKDNLKLKVFRQLNSAGVFEYYDEYRIQKYLKSVNIKFVNNNVPFVPSFTKIYSRIENLKGMNALNLGNKINIPKRKEFQDSQIYLLKNIYYGEFIEEFVNNKQNFDKTVKKIIDINKKAGKNKETKFYKLEKFEKLKADTAIEYMSKLQSLHQKNYDRGQNKDVYVDFVQKIFLKGFIDYLQKSSKFSSLNLLYFNEGVIKNDKKSKYDEEIKKMELNIHYTSPLAEEIKEYSKLIQVEDIKYNDRIANFYLIIKLLNHKELTNLKGNLEKYDSMNSSNLYKEELKLLNYINIDNNKVQSYFDLEAKEVAKFLNNSNISDNISLNEFSEKYSDGINIIKYRSFYNMKKYGVLNLIKKIVDKANYKITKKDIKELVDLESKIDEIYKTQETIHKEYNGKKIEEDTEDYDKYEKSIKNIEEYIQLKNKVEFNDLNLLQSIMFRILHRLAGYTSIWERNLKFELKGKYPQNQYIDEIFSFDNEKNIKYKNGGILEKYCEFIVDLTDENISKSQKIKEVKNLKNKLGLVIRNEIAHFNYLPNPKMSILEMLHKLRNLLKSDRKLKNAVMKSIKDIFEEYGFEVIFNIDHTSNETISVKVKSKVVKHFGGDFKTEKNSKELCNLLKVMLEFAE